MFKFIDENCRELKRVPVELRRKVFLSAVKKSYKTLRLWVNVGFAIIASLYCYDLAKYENIPVLQEWAFCVGLVIIWWTQRSIICAEIENQAWEIAFGKKKKESRSAVDTLDRL
jgi:hypothetical protein